MFLALARVLLFDKKLVARIVRENQVNEGLKGTLQSIQAKLHAKIHITKPRGGFKNLTRHLGSRINKCIVRVHSILRPSPNHRRTSDRGEQEGGLESHTAEEISGSMQSFMNTLLQCIHKFWLNRS